MTPEALSRLTWTLEDRRAWLAAYHRAREIAAERAEAYGRALAMRDAMVDACEADGAEASAQGYVRGRDDVNGPLPLMDANSTNPLEASIARLRSDARPECVAYQVGRHSRGEFTRDDYCPECGQIGCKAYG